MSDRHTLADIIDACLDDIVSGRASVSDCLERYPAHRLELEALLVAAAAMQAIPRRAERAPDPIRRAMLMEQIRVTPQQRRSWLPGVAAALFTGALMPRLVAVAAPVAAAAVLGAFLLVSQPAAPAAASTLTVFAGQAEEQAGGSWRPLADGAAVRQGARIRTSGDGYALLTFPDGSTSSLDPGTEVSIEALSAGKPRLVSLRQYTGRLWNDVVTDMSEGARYEVLTPDAVVQVQGTVFETAIDDGQTAVATAEGLVHVVAGAERVSVPSGQIVRAQAQQIAEQAQVQAAGSLVVDAPFTAALLSERGEATGARTDGAMFRQIRGVTTSNPGEGPQRFEFQRMEPGEYTLVLQRFEQGGGDLVLHVDGEERRVPLDDSSGAAQVRVKVEMQDGQRRVVFAEDRPAPAPVVARPPVRIVETERTRSAADVASQRAAAVRARRTPTATPTRTPTPTATRTRTSTPEPTIGAAGGPTTGTAAAPGASAAFAARLRAAVTDNDAAAIRDLVDEASSGPDTGEARARLSVLAGLLDDDESAERVSAALAGDAGLRSRLLDRAVTLSDDQEQRLRRALTGDPRATPTPVRTPTRPPSRETPPPRGASPSATATRTVASTPERSEAPPRSQLPAVVDGFSIRLRIALGTRNDELIRRALADVVADEASVTRARLDVLADMASDGEYARRIGSALEGSAGAALRERLLRAVDSYASDDLRARLRTLFASAEATATANVTVTSTATATTTASATATATSTARR